jgi:hypothetical protein
MRSLFKSTLLLVLVAFAFAAPRPASAQRAVLYEEHPNDLRGKRYDGSVIWRSETESSSAGQWPELAIKADLEIPERKLAATWSLRRNTDRTLPASHVVEVKITLSIDSPIGRVSSIPGLLMKPSEQTRGTPLAGHRSRSATVSS